MIEINLLPGKKRKAPGGGGVGFKLALPDFRGLLASIKNPWLLAASATSLVVVGGGLLWFITQSTRLRVAENRRTEVQAEKRRFDAVIAQKRQSEHIRDSLVKEITVIRGIDGTATSGRTCSTSSPRPCRPTPGSRESRPPRPARQSAHRLPRPAVRRPRTRRGSRRCGSGSPAAPWTSRPTPRSCVSSPRRPG